MVRDKTFLSVFSSGTHSLELNHLLADTRYITKILFKKGFWKLMKIKNKPKVDANVSEQQKKLK